MGHLRWPRVSAGVLRTRRPSSVRAAQRPSSGHHLPQYLPSESRNNHFCTSVNIISVWMLAAVLPLLLLKSVGLTDEETGSKAKQEKSYPALFSSQFRIYRVGLLLNKSVVATACNQHTRAVISSWEINLHCQAMPWKCNICIFLSGCASTLQGDPKAGVGH